MLRRACLAALTLCQLLGAADAATEKHPGMDAVIGGVAAGDEARAAQARALLQGATYQQAIIDAISRPAEGVKPWHAYRPPMAMRKTGVTPENV